MKNALTAFASAASLCCALATAAWAQDYQYPYGGEAPTVPSNTGAPLYSYHNTAPQPGAVGSCEIISGNRVCNGNPAGYTYDSTPGGPVGSIIGAPFAMIAAPFGFVGGQPASSGATYAPATGTAPYSYGSSVPPQPGAVGYCDIISGNRICFP
jgi:hypothetical protein